MSDKKPIIKVLLLGSTGMAGCALYRHLLSRGCFVVGIARKNADFNCDLTNDAQLESILGAHDFDAIINSAALVDIDYCEAHSVESWNINARLVSVLSNWCQKYNIPLLHISTDHFFTYGEDKPHKENDRITCVNEYSRHKYAAEAFALAYQDSLVIRTSILGVRSAGKASLIEWAVKKITDKEPIKLFCDAWTSSLDVVSFADFALRIFFDTNYRGLINVAAGEVYSKEALIRCVADKLGLSHHFCTSASVQQLLTLRANCLGLDVTKAEGLLKQEMPKLDEICDALIAQMYH